MNYWSKVEKALEKILYLQVVVLLPLSVAIGSRSFQHSEREWNGAHRLIYHVYLVPVVVKLNNAIALA